MGIHRQTFTVGEVVPGGQPPIALDALQNPFNVSALVNIVSGTAEYSVEVTHDDLSGDPSEIQWVGNVLGGSTSTRLYKIDAAITGVRLNLQVITGEVRLSVIQGILR